MLIHGAGSLTRCLFARNRAGAGGGALALLGSPAITSSTFFGNGATAGGAPPSRGAHLIDPGGAPASRRSILASAPRGAAIDCTGALTIAIECSDLWDHEELGACAFAAADLIAADPRFCDPAGESFTLRASSPCAAEHAPPGCGLIGALDVACPADPVLPASWGSLKARYRGR
jgi:hypothetical protein